MNPNRRNEINAGPTPPATLQEAGLPASLVHDLILKTLYLSGDLRGRELARALCLPFNIIKEALDFLRKQKTLEVTDGNLAGEIGFTFSLTDLGRRRAQEALKRCAYSGPAPVPLADYVEQVYRQAITGIDCAPEALRSFFAHLVLPEVLFDALGPAIVSGKSVFIYGPPGNGKTSIARAIGEFLTNVGGTICVPHALLAGNNIITVFDESIHVLDRPAEAEPFAEDEMKVCELLNIDTIDARWVRIRRPVCVTGGELTLDMLDLSYHAEGNYYQAPLHIKANGGVFLIDDFGRQLVSPKELLNRWILPLEERHDFLTAASGKKFSVPFEQLIIFSTNLDPRDLVDDAFLRRIRHKVEIGAPEREVYERIFAAMAQRLGMSPSREAVDYLYERYYERGRSPRGSDCRDLLEIVQSICRYRHRPVELSRELIAKAAESFIPEF